MPAKEKFRTDAWYEEYQCRAGLRCGDVEKDPAVLVGLPALICPR